MLILSLCAFHISNIDGLYEELRIDETKKIVLYLKKQKNIKKN